MRADVPVRGVAQDLLQVRFAAPRALPWFWACRSSAGVPFTLC